MLLYFFDKGMVYHIN